MAAFEFAADKGADLRAIFQEQPRQRPRHVARSFDAAPVAARREEPRRGGSSPVLPKRKAKEKKEERERSSEGCAAPVSEGHKKRFGGVALVVPVLKQARRVLAFELFVMDKATVESSMCWFTDLTDEQRREYYALELRREEIAEGQRKSIDGLLKAKENEKQAEKQSAKPAIEAAVAKPPPKAPVPPAKKLKLVVAPIVPAAGSGGNAAAAVTHVAVKPKEKEKSSEKLPQDKLKLERRALDEYTKEFRFYENADGEFVEHSPEELKRLWDGLPKQQQSVYFNRAFNSINQGKK